MDEPGDGRPANIGEYVAWLKRTFNCEPRSVLQSQYDAAVSKALADVRQSQPWSTLTSQLREINDEYQIQTGYRLFVTDEPPELIRKPFPSLFLKTFRKNVTANSSWPNAPDSGWWEPSKWLTQVNDALRTTLVVKYLDGVAFAADRLAGVAATAGVFSRIDYEASEAGYYAGHFYVYVPVEVPEPNWDTEQLTISVEVQITTQLQEVIRRLTHAHYERRRLQIIPPSVKWQWDYTSPEFAPNYLGHILHYLEGMILEVRDRSPDERKTTEHEPD